MFVWIDYLIFAPKGNSANLINLNCWIANGIPIIEIPNIKPIKKWYIANSIPEKIIQKIFKIECDVLLLIKICFPNGKRIKFENLKHCNPIGIPIMVKHQQTPIRNQTIDEINPPKIIHNKLPKKFILIQILC